MSKKQKKILWPVLLTVLLAPGVLAFVAGRPRSVIGGAETTMASAALKKSWPVSPESDELAQPGVIPHGPVRVVRFTLYDAGIFPREVRVNAGTVAITIEDFSGGTAGLVVAPEIGSDRIPLGVVQRFAHHWRGRGELTMTPGSYVVFDSSRPSNRAKLIVQP